PDVWRSVRGFRDLVLQKTAAGCKVRVLIVHEENPALPQLLNANILQRDFEAMLVKNREIFQFYQRLAAQTSGLEVRRIMQGCPHFRLTRTDQLAVLTPYFYAAKSEYSPVLEAKTNSSLYELAQQEFETLWQANETVASASES
ncbi:MAG TPA: hypothetical protein VE821_13065, partial [Pyrinomonadaceae bacterium]|nr:hypothetical protein [Pyrinomonadaceae bacterium]